MLRSVAGLLAGPREKPLFLQWRTWSGMCYVGLAWRDHMLTDHEIDLTPSQGRKLEGLRRKIERDHPGGDIKEWALWQLEESDWPTQKRTLVVRCTLGSPLEKDLKFFEVLRLTLVYTITAKGKVELATTKGLYGNAELQEDDS